MPVTPEEWTKSSRSGTNADCVELMLRPSTGQVMVRDSKDPDGAQLALDLGSYRELLAAIRAGHFDL